MRTCFQRCVQLILPALTTIISVAGFGQGAQMFPQLRATAKTSEGAVNVMQFVGADIGEQTNAAIASLPGGCGEVVIPPGTYPQTSTIIMPRCVKLHGASGYGTTLKFAPTATPGWSIIVADNLGDGYYSEGAIEDLALSGPGAGTTAGGIYIGGSDGQTGSPALTCDPPTVTICDPATNYGDHVNINRVKVGIQSAGCNTGFGVGIRFGNNAWSDSILESAIDCNGTGVYFPSGLNNSGERLGIIGSSIQNSSRSGSGIAIRTGGGIATLDLQLIDCSLDYNASWAIQNGNSAGNQTIEVTDSHIEQAAKYFQNYGVMTITGTSFVGGSQSGALGYLVDNKFNGLTIVGGYLHNDGKGLINNPGGIGGVWVGVTATSAINNTLVNIDRLNGTINTNGTISMSSTNQTSSNQYAGVSSCRGGMKEITLPRTYNSQPVISVFDETTQGGVSLIAKTRSGFTVSCAGVGDTFDWIVVGNPN
ncbi:MAG: hypothetical protein WBV69_12170 [Candidatus Sulfotelmatobacter sp.]